MPEIPTAPRQTMAQDNPLSRLQPGEGVHIVGIGGAGMSAIARVLLQQGYRVSGSDRELNALTEALQREGASIYEGVDATRIGAARLVLASSAIAEQHAELVEARVQGLTVVRRTDFIADLMHGREVVAVAGTHGKTTTSAMIAHILQASGREPGYIIGSVAPDLGSNAAAGKGAAFVVEADEYDHMFLGLRPDVAVLGSAEYDHPDCFPNHAAMLGAFRRFINLLPETGPLIACLDDPAAAQLAEERRAQGLPVQGFSSQREATWQARQLHLRGDGCSEFEALHQGRVAGPVTLRLPGEHNVRNALAALAVAIQQNVPFAAAATALAAFRGTGRRLELRGVVDDVLVIDDYAHHPTAIRLTLAAARARWPGHRLWALWQPHTYSRSQALQSGYVTAFADADELLVTDIYAAREEPLPGLDGASLAAAVARPRARHTPTGADALQLLVREVKGPALILILSAGDAPRIGEQFLARGGGDAGAARSV
ncbi:MAG: UDP-N-acetylmuramate--L-alanine ligase [Anaerolineae bacterium]|nr:UDP-N-acetylmuramate--L-alanine ligase [Anaerolineae bacterium]